MIDGVPNGTCAWEASGQRGEVIGPAQGRGLVGVRIDKGRYFGVTTKGSRAAV